jgi:hypothetical protein
MRCSPKRPGKRGSRQGGKGKDEESGVRDERDGNGGNILTLMGGDGMMGGYSGPFLEQKRKGRDSTGISGDTCERYWPSLPST